MNNKESLISAYHKSPHLSIKYNTYFPVYERLLSKYRGHNITLLEVGIFQGGSLFMWREFLGNNARIIGIDLNPDAKEWEKYGFEIYVGDQASDEFWEKLYQQIGTIDVMIDDGGHTNQQQVITAHHAIMNLNDNGILIVEDVHTNYFREFGNPSLFSFLNFSHRIVDGINSRSSSLRQSYKRYSDRVYCVIYFESIVAFEINSRLCIKSTPTSNNGATRGAKDFRYNGRIGNILFKLKNKINSTNSIPTKLVQYGIDNILALMAKAQAYTYKKYFNNKP